MTDQLTVWAPAAGRVHAILGAERVAMHAGEGGWWALDRELPAGTDYAFSLDGGDPLPHPRSPWQPELGDSVRDGRREEFVRFGWNPDEVPDPQAAQTFQRSQLRWEERTQGEHADMLEWHRALIALRQATPALLDPRLSQVSCRCDPEAGWFTIDRGGIGIAFNLAAEPVALELAGSLLLGSATGVGVGDGRLTLPSNSVAVLELGA
jgi:maltooligosyltrehalose trehalohydrolase